MTNSMTVVDGVVKSDGTLELHDKVSVPAGPVQVTIVSRPELPSDDPFWQMMQAIWTDQKARGHVPRSAEEVESERRIFREEWEERMQHPDQLQEAARKLREQDA